MGRFAVLLIPHLSSFIASYPGLKGRKVSKPPDPVLLVEDGKSLVLIALALALLSTLLSVAALLWKVSSRSIVSPRKAKANRRAFNFLTFRCPNEWVSLTYLSSHISTGKLERTLCLYLGGKSKRKKDRIWEGRAPISLVRMRLSQQQRVLRSVGFIRCQESSSLFRPSFRG